MVKVSRSSVRSMFCVLAVVTCLGLSARADTAPASVPPPLKGMDVGGEVHPLADDLDVKASALIFISPQCPISNKYVPELNRIAKSHEHDGVHVFRRDLRSDDHPRRGCDLCEGISIRVSDPVRRFGRISQTTQPDDDARIFCAEPRR